MRVSLPKLRCLEDDPDPEPDRNTVSVRSYAFVFAPPPYGPQQVGIQLPRYTPKGYTIAAAALVDVACPLADRVLERGELLIVTADNLRLLHFTEESGMFRRVGLTDSEKAEAR
jgi:hypothetical protein